MRTAPAPESEQALLAHAKALAGLPLYALAQQAGVALPPDLKRHKGFVGELVEALLGATASSLPEPDFPHLGIELKTLPVDMRHRPRESTYVCTVPIDDAVGHTWETSWVRRKLARVLWIPVQADRILPLGERRLGAPLLWSPDAEQEALLRRDYEELMDLVCLGGIEHVTAHLGTVLQIRPKAPHARARRAAVAADGDTVRANPRGFYLRAGFTAALLRRHYAR